MHWFKFVRFELKTSHKLWQNLFAPDRNTEKIAENLNESLALIVCVCFVNVCNRFAAEAMKYLQYNKLQLKYLSNIKFYIGKRQKKKRIAHRKTTTTTLTIYVSAMQLKTVLCPTMYCTEAIGASNQFIVVEKGEIHVTRIHASELFDYRLKAFTAIVQRRI